jgi:hypothetical protein
MNTSPWWEVEKLLTEKDKQALEHARSLHFGEIDENEAETALGRQKLREMIIRKYHNEEYCAGMI